MTTRALETYWSGFAAWLLDRTDRPSWRHREAVARVRGLTLAIGDDLVALRHSLPVPQLRSRLDQLAWQIDVLANRGGVDATVQRRTHEALRCLQALLPGRRAPPQWPPAAVPPTPAS